MDMYMYMYMSMYIYVCVYLILSDFPILKSLAINILSPCIPPSPPSPTFHCPSYWQFLDCQTPCPWHDTIFCPSKELHAEGATMPLAILDHASIG